MRPFAVNEIEILRAQLSLEAQHARAVARLAASDGEGDERLRAACEEYLATVLGWSAAREQRLIALIETPLAAPLRDAVRAALAREGTSAAALALLQAARARAPGWPELAQFLDGNWRLRQEALDAALAPSGRIAHWRTAVALRAEQVLRERALYARVTALRPARARDGGGV